jgi:fused signal recognition particle receptor
VFVTGVNGSGKTTSIGKLAHYLREKGKKVLIAPCDRFRAAAGEQIVRWAERAGVDILLPSQGDGQRADSILFEAIRRAHDERYDILLVDTAGRLNNKKSLMEELAKLSRVLDKHALPDTSIDRWLVIDSTTGQNGFRQAVDFDEMSPLSGIILSKFDGTAKGGIIFALSHKLNIPIKFIGTGETLGDIRVFCPQEYTESVLGSS